VRGRSDPTRLQSSGLRVTVSALEPEVGGPPRLLHGLAKGAARRGQEHPPRPFLVDLTSDVTGPLETGQGLADPSAT
jgi:hypothetical protein